MEAFHKGMCIVTLLEKATWKQSYEVEWNESVAYCLYGISPDSDFHG